MAKKGRKAKAEEIQGVEVHVPGVKQPGPLPPYEAMASQRADGSIVLEKVRLLPEHQIEPREMEVTPEGIEFAAELGLSPEHILTHRRTPEGGVVIVTRGGVKLRWPEDIEAAKALTPSQKDGQRHGPDPSTGGVLRPPAEHPEGK